MSRCKHLVIVLLVLLSYSGVEAQSIEPTSIPTLQPSSYVISVSPSTEPPSIPTQQPKVIKTSTPTHASASPSTEPTRIPTQQPIVIKTSTPTHAPQQRRPSLQPTRVPTFSIQGPIVRHVQMQLNGIDSLSQEDQFFFGNHTKDYIEMYYLSDGKDFVNSFHTQIKVIRVDPNPSTSKFSPSKGRRRLATASGPTSLLITYDQAILYRPLSPNIHVDDSILLPFMNIVLRNSYISYLQSSGRTAFMNVKSVELPIICDGNCFPGSSNNLPLIIGASVGGGSALVIILIIWLLCCRRKALNKDGRSRPLLTRHKDEIDASSNLEPPVRSVLTNGEETSVVSVDYDYSRAYYIEGNEQSVSSAGGTLGSATRRSKLSGVESKGISGGGTTLSTDEASFEARFRKQIVREETLIVIAPAGKLGVVIDSPEVGGPVVHAIKEGSVLANKLRVGDRLVAVDEEDVRSMSAIKVSKLISRKGLNAERKLTVVRSIQTTK